MLIMKVYGTIYTIILTLMEEHVFSGFLARNSLSDLISSYIVGDSGRMVAGN